MTEQFRPVQELLDRVRTRWRRLVLFDGVVRGALASAAVIAVALTLTHWTSRAPVALAVIGAAALAGVLASVAWGLWPIRRVPTDRAVARFIEERDSSLDERLVSAVNVNSVERANDRPA